MNAIPRIRAGAVACLCSLEELGIVAREGVGLLAVGAAASALSQIAMFSLLPLAGHMLAPSPGLAPLPFAALFVGTIVATFFASVLTDTLGRRTALALGASLGIAGGLVVAWALIAASFYPLAVGAFWIGVASGFALFGPANLPRPLVDRINGSLVKALNDPSVKNNLGAQGADIVASTPEQHDKFNRNEIAKWIKVARNAHIEAE